MARRLSFKTACARYVYRYTMEHVPAWAARPNPQNGCYYAPQFRSDKEWYENTTFPNDTGHDYLDTDCHTSGQTWPLGKWLDKPYRKAI